MITLHGDCLTHLKQLEANSLDSLVTDPPAGISFMGKEWDDDKGGRLHWIGWMTLVMTECLRVLKPGAHGLVWALPRTSHWTATALEEAGFEVRDVVTHLFGTGFPKSMDISKAIDKAAGAEREVISKALHRNHSSSGGILNRSETPRFETVTAPSTDAAKEWAGWGTALKPASEHWILVRKPLSEKTVAANVLKWGVGGINIDGCRVSSGSRPARTKSEDKGNDKSNAFQRGSAWATGETTQGRFPANLVVDEEAAAALDEQSLAGGMHSAGRPNTLKGSKTQGAIFRNSNDVTRFGDSGGASRFFYVAKASKTDKGADNTHPTVKSTALMRYLTRLVTPPNGTVLDPFMGSGTTGVAAKAEGFEFVGIEMSEEYHAIASWRIGGS